MSALINKYLSKKELQIINDLKNSLEKEKITITCIGLYNHGKSMLLNALIGDFGLNTFEVADKRETIRNKEIEFENFYYVDTPGLNAKENDDKRALDAIKETDLILFVHKATTGEFQQGEVDFLKKIEKNWQSPKEFIKKTIFVISSIDELNNEKEDLERLISKMDEQIDQIFNTKADFIAVSSNRYIRGKKEKKEILAKKGNIDKLKEKIEKFNQKYKNEFLQVKKDRLKKYYEELIKKFGSIYQKKKLRLFQLKREKENYLKLLEEDKKKVEDTLNKKYKALEEL